MTYIQDLEQQQEYQQREAYFVTVFKFICKTKHRNELRQQFIGTQQQYDKLANIYQDGEIMVTHKSYDKPEIWDFDKRPFTQDLEEQKRRRNFNNSHYKEGTQRTEAYRYLRGGF